MISLCSLHNSTFLEQIWGRIRNRQPPYPKHVKKGKTSVASRWLSYPSRGSHREHVRSWHADYSWEPSWGSFSWWNPVKLILWHRQKTQINSSFQAEKLCKWRGTQKRYQIFFNPTTVTSVSIELFDKDAEKHSQALYEKIMLRFASQ